MTNERKTLTIEARALRRYVLARLGLGPGENWRRAGLVEQIERLGFVQVDSVRAVERAHDMILFSRDPSYRRADLVHALERERSLFENWTHDAAVIPTGFHRHWRRRFRRAAAAYGLEERAEVARVAALLEREGAMSAREAEDRLAREDGRPPDRRVGMWAWNPVKTALEHGWRAGLFAIDGRNGFEKRYDLAERALGDVHAAPDPAEEETIDWAAREALDRLGAASAGEIAAFWRLIDVNEAKGWIARGLERRALRRVAIAPEDGSKPRPAIAPADIEARLAAAGAPPRRLAILSPFDPVARDRKRLAALFAFDFTLEMFKPARERRYGHYVFPLLSGERFAGRLDLAADRKRGALELRAYWPEPGAPQPKKGRLEGALDALRRFSGLERVAGLERL